MAIVVGVSGALFPPGTARRTKRAVLLTVAVLLLATVICGGGAVLAANLLGLTGCEPRPPYVSAVQEDVRRVGSLIPALGNGNPSGAASGSASASASGSPSASGAPGDGSASPSAGPSGVVAVHYHFRDSVPHTCPQIATLGTVYEGFAQLTPERAEALRGLRWTPADAPDVPDDLQQFAPANAAWQRSADLDTATGAKVWYDQASRTAFFSYYATD
ncbi:hypothetical protein Vau01_013310 [Virgisporangium aurantiacum]|uniref:Uncharacterized protein n=1 Tax=Virgisporangium aurantiacum TaxID=175570 RepID=A0A8J4DWT0_9ACTN|nr:hypothetical protein Vau01_013310 [Virgisporangium aurantiacum]